MGKKEAMRIDFKEDKRFIGHPKGMQITSTMALAQAFANYGMTAILIYYLYTSVSEGGLGFSHANAAQFVNVYTAFAGIAGIIGGYVADRFLGVRKAITIGYAVATAGYFLLAVPGGGPALYLASQIMLLAAAVCRGNSLYALAGKLYAKDDGRRDSGFSIMYVMNNVGAVAPVITGTIAQVLNYHMGFLFAAVIQFIGWIIYAASQNKVFGDAGIEPDDPFSDEKRNKMLFGITASLLVFVLVVVVLFVTGIVTPTAFCNVVSVVSIFIPIIYIVYIYNSKKTSKEEAVRIIPFIFIFAANCFNMMIWNQSTTILAIYAAERVNMNFFGFKLTPAAFQTVPAVYAIIFGTLAASLWTKMKEKQPNTPLKFGIGTVFYGLATLFMIMPFVLYPANVKVNPMWLMIFYALMIWGEAMTSPVGMSTASKVAPVAFTAQMMTVWQLGLSTGSGLSALAVNFYKEGSESIYFLEIGGATFLIGLILWIFNKKLDKMME